MDDGGSLTIVDGVIRLDHPEIEAGLHTLAAQWQTTVAEAFGMVLRRERDAVAADRSTASPDRPI